MALKGLLRAAIAREYTFKVVSEDGTVDYLGFNFARTMDAIEAVDEAIVYIYDEDGANVGSVLVINGLDEDERCADASGWADIYLEMEI